MNITEILQNIRIKSAECLVEHLQLTAKIPVLKRQAKIAQSIAKSYNKELGKLDLKFDSSNEWAEMRNELYEIIEEAEDAVSELLYEIGDIEERLICMEELAADSYNALIDAFDGSRD